jgi:hypothetical protein
MEVPLEVSKTLFTSTEIKGDPSMSMRQNFTPWLIGAGYMVSVTFFPVCKPAPEIVTGFFMVLCFSLITPAKIKNNYLQCE